MAKSYYLPADDNGKAAWLNNLSGKLPTYQAALGLTAADVGSVTADAAFFAYALNAQTQVTAYAQQWTAYKNSARSGSGTALGLAPVAPAFDAAPTAVASGIFGRARLHQCHWQALQLIGADNPVDPTTLKPVLDVELDAGEVDISWTKQGMDGLEIQVDRGDGKGFVFLAIDTIPNYTDTAAMPTAGQSALWKYGSSGSFWGKIIG